MSTFGAFSVVRSTVKRVLNSSGVLAEVAINTPAFEFNTDGTYRGLLVEPAATNILLRSAEFDNATWGKEATSSITATNGVAPDGTSTADTYTLGATPGSARIQQSFTVSSGATITNSVFVKKSVGTHIRFVVIDSATATSSYGAWFNLDTGAVGTSGAGGTGVFTSASIQAYPNSWYRISVVGSIPATTGYQSSLYIATADNSGTRLANGAVLLWGAQAETGSVATSYIPTVASTANRTADSVTLTGASSLIGQTEGTLYAEVTTRLTGGSSGKRILSINDGTNDNRIEIIKASNDGITMFVVVGGVTVVNESYSSNLSGIVKIAVRYANNAYYLHVGGTLRNSDLSATVPACSVVRIGSSVSTATPFNDCVRSVALFPSSLSEAQANALTT